MRALRAGGGNESENESEIEKLSEFEGQAETPQVLRQPTEQTMVRAGSFDGDLRDLPQTPVKRFERPEFEFERDLIPMPGTDPGTAGRGGVAPIPPPGPPSAPAPATSTNFEGMDFNTYGQGHPPDTNGDVGPNHFIETINSHVAIYSKAGGAPSVAFSFDALMSQGVFGNKCDANNLGDPVVVYDTFEDRWILSDFAFSFSGADIAAPGVFECLAVSKTGDPVGGGWNFYSFNTTGAFGDYPKLGIWPDGLYASFNMFTYTAPQSFLNVRVYAVNKAQMYAGAPTVQIVAIDAPAGEFSLMPSNARLQTGTPPVGRENLFTTVRTTASLRVFKFHVDWTHLALSTLSGPFDAVTPALTQFTGTGGRVVSPANGLDSLSPRLMMQNQYSNIGGVESLWNSHTVGSSGVPTQASPRFYQVKVTGGTVEANATQAFTFTPDATHRWMPGVAVNKLGDMAIGYNATSAVLNPAIRYAGRLAGDAPNTITLTEQSLVEGGGSQSGNCGGSACTRWGDYSTMTLDPDGCRFWFVGMYYQATGLNHNTRIGAFSYPGCTANTTGSLSGTVKNAANLPLGGVTVELGVRTTTTNATGAYSFAGLPAGTYPSVKASKQGYNSSAFTNIAVAGGGAAVQNITLTAPAATSGCFVDTSQADFQADVATDCDLNTPAGSVVAFNNPALDQQNTSVTNSGFGVTATSWAGQSFTPAVTGLLTRADLFLFCANTCNGTTPNITVSVRATSGGVPTGADLATATIAGFSSGAGAYYTANFASPATLTALTRYAVIFRPVSNPSAGIYAYAVSSGSPYVNGATLYDPGTSSGVTWLQDATDTGFRIYIQSGYAPTSTFTSSLKDANPGVGGAATWSNISWNINTPAGTGVTFQVAGSNSPNGPFTFVGPDGTSGTNFSNSGSLAQFNGKRYLRYKAVLTSNGAATPMINDVTVCFSNAPRPVLDLNADGNGDVFTYHSPTGVWKREVTQANGTFASTGASSGLFNWLPGWTVVPAKFNEDANTDFFLFNSSNGNWYKMLNDGVSGFTAQAFSQWWPGWQRFVMDLDGDVISDIFLYDPATGVWFKALSTATGFTYLQGAWNPNWDITPMTLNADAMGDMFLINRTTGRWFWALGAAGAGFTYPASASWYPSWNLYPGDFNADGLTDLLLHDPPTGAWFVSMNNGLGTGFTYTSGYWILGWTPYVGDFDADGDKDLFLHNPNNGVWYEMISDGIGQFTVGGSGMWTLGWNIYPTDLNSDGRTDILLYNPTTGVWYQSRNLVLGTFTYSTGTWATGLTIIVRSPYL